MKRKYSWLPDIRERKVGFGRNLKIRVLKKQGIFIKGKFDQISSDTPYATFVQAFNELAQLILAGDNAFQQKWKKRITEAIGNSGKILTQFMPGIETLIGKQPGLPELKGIEAQNRFNYEFTRFIKTIADKESPLVIFVDDLQWADASSLNLFKIIAENRDIGYVMLIGGYRKNEVDETHPLCKKVDELREDNVKIEEIDLKDLEYTDVYHLVSDALLTNQENTSFLADIIYNKTKGNAFYVWQFLKSIYEEGFLHFDFDSYALAMECRSYFTNERVGKCGGTDDFFHFKTSCRHTGSAKNSFGHRKQV